MRRTGRFVRFASARDFVWIGSACFGSLALTTIDFPFGRPAGRPFLFLGSPSGVPAFRPCRFLRWRARRDRARSNEILDGRGWISDPSANLGVGELVFFRRPPFIQCHGHDAQTRGGFLRGEKFGLCHRCLRIEGIMAHTGTRCRRKISRTTFLTRKYLSYSTTEAVSEGKPGMSLSAIRFFSRSKALWTDWRFTPRASAVFCSAGVCFMFSRAIRSSTAR